MTLQYIKLENLHPSKANVRKVGAKDVADLVPSIENLGLLQPLLVRPNAEGYEIIAGQRRYHALCKIAEDRDTDPVPCLVMDDSDEAAAIEASLIENVARMPMNEIDQYKAFAALIGQGLDIDGIASRFGVTERLVKQRLAIANLYAPILSAYRKEQVQAQTVRLLTMASKARQKEWWKLFNSKDDYAPTGQELKRWLLGGADIPVKNALFPLENYTGSVITDLFGEDRYFDDADAFWALQNLAISNAKDIYLGNGWQDVIILDIGAYWSSWEHVKTPKKNGGHVFVEIRRDGEVSFHEGYLTTKEAARREKVANGEPDSKSPKPELTNAMQNYLDLHRHAAVRAELLNHASLALRLVVAQIIAGSDLWSVHADPQKAASDPIADSLTTNKAERKFAEERQAVRELLGWQEEEGGTIVPNRNDWQRHIDLHELFARLLQLDDEVVTRILTFVVAEALPAGSAMVEGLGNRMGVDMGDYWQVDQTFLDLHRDKEAINAMLKDIGGKNVADGNISATAKVQKKIIADILDGTRKSDKKSDGKKWQPLYMRFPFAAYTKRGGINAIENWKAVRKHFS